MDLPDGGRVWSGHDDLLHVCTDGRALPLIRQVKCFSGNSFLRRGPGDLVLEPLVCAHQCSVLDVFRVPAAGVKLKDLRS